MASPHSNGPRPFADAFQAYWAAGWRGLVPVTGKHPPQTGYTGVEGLWPSYPDCQAWADGPEGGRNIALRLPDGIIGLDIDQYGTKHGGATLANCEAQWGPLPPTWRSTSRSDNVSGIRFYRVPAGMAWPGQLPGGDVELIQKHHRYAVVWPSIHPEGRVYRWISREGTVSLTGVPGPDVLPKLPPQWIVNLSQGSERRAEARVDLPGTVLEWLSALPGADEEPCPWIRSERQELLRLLGSGTMARHDVLTRPLLALIRSCEEGHPGALTVVGEVQQRFVAMVTADKSRTPAEAGKEFARAVEGAAQRIHAEPTWPRPAHDPCRAGTPEDTRDRRAAAGTGGQAGTPWQNAGHNHGRTPEELLAERVEWLRADRQARRLLAEEEAPPVEEIPTAALLTEELDMPDEVVPYRLTGLLPIGARVLLSAQAKVGKTTLVGNLVRALVDGVPFLGRYEMARPLVGTVMVIDTEMNRLQLRRWLREQGITNTDQVHVISLIGKAHTFDLRVPKLMEHWTNELVRCKAEIVIIDPLKPILDSLALSERADTGLITTPFTALKEAACISELILTHHSGHNGERARGDSSLRGWPEVEWGMMLTRPEDGSEPDPAGPRFFKAFGRDVEVAESALKYDEARRHLVFEGGSRSQVRRARRSADLESAVLAAIADNPGIGHNQIRQLVGGSNTTLQEKLMDLGARSMIFKGVGSKGQRLGYTINQQLFPESVPEVSSAVTPPLLRNHVAERSGAVAVTDKLWNTDDQGPADE